VFICYADEKTELHADREGFNTEKIAKKNE